MMAVPDEGLRPKDLCQLNIQNGRRTDPAGRLFSRAGLVSDTEISERSEPDIRGIRRRVGPPERIGRDLS